MADETPQMLHITPTKKKKIPHNPNPLYLFSATHPGRPLIRNHVFQVSAFSGDGAGVTHTRVALQGGLLCPRHVRLSVHQ